MSIHQELRYTIDHMPAAPSWPLAMPDLAAGFALALRTTRGLLDASPLRWHDFYSHAEQAASDGRIALSDAPGRVRAFSPCGEPTVVDRTELATLHQATARLADAIYDRFAADVTAAMDHAELIAFGDAFGAAHRLQLVLAQEIDDDDLH